MGGALNGRPPEVVSLALLFLNLPLLQPPQNLTLGPFFPGRSRALNGRPPEDALQLVAYASDQVRSLGGRVW